MWLLNTTTRELTPFHSDPPQYVILSHTWGEEEVTFQDIANRSDVSVTSKQGYLKISGFCEEASRHGFKWVWVDTCCIDKSSSAELSEAINSMFAWYRKAVICYVYLSDFTAVSDPTTNFAFRGLYCRWFTRGWTLQELVAPEIVVFYDQSWKEIGTKRSLAPIISQITGIGQELLAGVSTVKDYSIAQRMSWAASRTTTRIEDIAYSLLGIFEINMPLLYGEGLRSFARLQEEIIKTSYDETIFAWKTGLDVLSGQKLQRSVILAYSPTDFRHSSRIVPISQNLRNAHVDEPVTIINRGLRISLRFDHWRGNLLGIFDCYSLDFPEERIAILLEDSSTNVTGLRYQRISPEILRRVPAREHNKVRQVHISPVWMNPPESISRFPIRISTNLDLGNSGYSLRNSNLAISEDSKRYLKSYTFGDDSATMFVVKVQWLAYSETVDPRIEIKVSSERFLLREWTSKSINTYYDRAEARLGSGRWKVAAKINYKVGGNSSKEEAFNLELQVSLRY